MQPTDTTVSNLVAPYNAENQLSVTCMLQMNCGFMQGAAAAKLSATVCVAKFSLACWCL